MKKSIILILTALIVFSFPFTVSAAPSIPVIIIQKLEVPEKVVPGEAFSISAVLFNAGVKNAENITVTLEPGGSETEDNSSVFIASGNGNVLFIDKIAKGKTAEIAFNIFTKSDTPSGIYELNINVKYSYSRINYENNFKVGIEVNEKELLVIRGLTFPKKIDISEKTELTGDIINISNTQIKAINAEYEVNGEKSNEFFGTFNSNDTDSLQFDLPAEVPGKYDVNITVSFYDTFGRKHDVSDRVTYEVVGEDATVPVQTPQESQGFLEFLKAIFGL